MSYIKKTKRVYVDAQTIGDCKDLKPDEVSYAIMQILRQNIEGKTVNEVNAYLGALKRAEQEVYSKYVKPVEDQLEFENGELD